MNYFGTNWNYKPEAPVGGGYAVARAQSDASTGFAGGVIEKRDAAGKVTDVIITYRGTDHDSVERPLDPFALFESIRDALEDAVFFKGGVSGPRPARRRNCSRRPMPTRPMPMPSFISLASRWAGPGAVCPGPCHGDASSRRGQIRGDQLRRAQHLGGHRP
ncbi:hypothetical protein D3874_09630 [Oleomonas cavernae]|uniref:Uncharacterized protein n=1 Tax=Oleomonas cavernae TaxID=2320859 RepID=A0A418WBE6_9PROT|nr:hypothetical protein [Oleomonas cavernae]RJF87258.1 hypothetical protein D3874_09630 [Oleomonas cavernae]